MIHSHFKNIKKHILEELSKAETSILIAVAWFTDNDIFNLLVQKASQNVLVELMLIDDKINNDCGIDFLTLFDNGGKIWMVKDETTMHNKFCIIDERVVINGSYNWTKKAISNHENIMVIANHAETIEIYKEQFKALKEQLFGNEREIYNNLSFRLSALKSHILLNDIEYINEQCVKLKKLFLFTSIKHYRELIKILNYCEAKKFSRAAEEINVLIKLVDTSQTNSNSFNSELYGSKNQTDGNEAIDSSFVVVWQRGMCGFMNKDKQMITRFKYDYAWPFSEGAARVKLNGKYGFINKKGKEIIPIKYNDAADFKCGFALVDQFEGRRKLEYSSFYIDSFGSKSKAFYDFYHMEKCSFSGGFARVKNKDNKWGFVNTNGKRITPFKYESAKDFNDGLACIEVTVEGNCSKYGYIDTNGTEVIPPEYGNAENFSEGMSHVSYERFDHAVNNIIINKKGDIIITYKFSSVSEFTLGKAFVVLYDFEGKLESFIIDKFGREIIQLDYDSIGEFHSYTGRQVLFIYNGLIKFCQNKKYGFINSEGKVIINNLYDWTQGFEKGFIVKINNKYGLIDFDGNTIVKSKYDEIGTWIINDYGFTDREAYVDGLCIVSSENKFGFIDLNGKEVIPTKYDYVSNFSNGLAEVRLKTEVYYIDRSGSRFSKFTDFDDIEDPYGFNGHVIEKDGRMGYMDSERRLVVPTIYENICRLEEGVFMVINKEKYGFINFQGEKITDIKYDGVIEYEPSDKDKNGLIGVCLNNKWGFINTLGEEICKLQFDSIESFSGGLAKVGIGGKFGFINQKGDLVIPAKFEFVKSFKNGMACFKENLFFGAIDIVGNIIIPPSYDTLHFFDGELWHVELNGRKFCVDLNNNEKCIDV